MNAVKNTATSGIKVVGSVWEDFRAFIDKGNVFDLAVGIVIGASFTAIVNSFVNDLITPVISLAIQTQLENKYYPLKPSSACENSTLCSTPKLAQAQGVVTLNWGNFIQVRVNYNNVNWIFNASKKYSNRTFLYRKKRLSSISS